MWIFQWEYLLLHVTNYHFVTNRVYISGFAFDPQTARYVNSPFRMETAHESF